MVTFHQSILEFYGYLIFCSVKFYGCFFWAIVSLGLQLLLVVVYVGTLLAIKHLVASRFTAKPADESHDK